jgi:hypothetical protein
MSAVSRPPPDSERWTILDSRHLIEETDRDAAARLFKKSVRMVEIEVFSYCNRRCWFCPNSSIDRISSNTFMPAAMYTAILEQLASIEYAGMLTYSRYNEPLADKIILERVAEARRLLPGALLHTNTNGDYLDGEYLEQLYDAGMRSLNIQIYLPNEERYDHEKIKKYGEKTLKRVGVPSKLIHDVPGSWLEYHLYYRDMSIRLYGRNFEVDGTSRGDQVPIHLDYARTSPCLVPFWAVYIDHDGSIVPCCNIRSDAPSHAEYVIGSLAKQSDLFLHFTGRIASQFRASLLNAEKKGGICANCHYQLETPTGVQLELLRDLTAKASGKAI